MEEARNAELEQAQYVIENTGANLFLTGKAGTGKTTFLRKLRANSTKRMVVLAPTGIAAINAGGTTIHSFFQLAFAPFIPGTNLRGGDFFKLSKQKRKLIRSLDLIVIDEMSMVRADLLDNIDASLRWIRRNDRPFGGVQMLMIGDLQQLAPVVKDEEWEMLKNYYKTPYFFSSTALKRSPYVTIELKKVYRQQDEHFLSLLNDIRDGDASQATLDELNSHCRPGFEPASDSGYIRLVTHNWQANAVNNRELERIAGRAFSYSATVKGDFPEASFPTDRQLTLKAGAQIMFVKNNHERGYYNGMIGRVTEISEEGFKVAPTNGRGCEIEVGRETWDNTKYKLNEGSGEIEEKVEGQYEQFPVRLAWAITIHKSQGLTFEHALIDAHAAFAHGQVYVALSRCKTLDGMVLSAPITKEAVINDNAIKKYSEYLADNSLDEGQMHRLGFEFYVDQMCRAFDFSEADRQMMALLRTVEANFGKSYAELTNHWEEIGWDFKENVVEVTGRFQKQLIDIARKSSSYRDDPALQQRMAKAADYFLDKLSPVAKSLESLMLPTDNKEVKKRTKEIVEELRNALRIAIGVMKHLLLNGFELADYMRERSRLEAVEGSKAQQGAAKAKSSSDEKEANSQPAADNVEHPELLQKLAQWRAGKAKALGVAAYMVLQQRAMMGIAQTLPQTKGKLLKVKCFGEVSYEKYGEEILAIVKEYADNNGISPQPETKKGGSTSREEEPSQSKNLTAKKAGGTKQISLELYKAGKGIAQIAKERGLVESTIFGHLVSFIPSGEVGVEELVESGKITLIENYIRNHPAGNDGEKLRATQIKEALGEAVSYNDIRAVMANMDHK